MPPPQADLATTWAFLEEGVDHIMTKLQTGVSYSKYMSLYTVAYNYCTSSKMHGTTSDQVSMGGNRSKFFLEKLVFLGVLRGSAFKQQALT
jgi:cullin 1